MTFFWQYLRQERLSVVSWAVSLALFGYFTAVLFPADTGGVEAIQDYLNSLPPSLQAMFGGSVALGTMEGWLQLNLYSWLPLIMIVYASISVAGVISKEIDSGTIEFLFSMPVSRSKLILLRFAALALNLAAIHAAVFFGTYLGVRMAGHPFPMSGSTHVTVMSFLVVLATAALLLLISIFITDYTRALFTGLGVGVGLYFVVVALEGADSYRALLPWLIFGNYNVGALMGGEVDAWRHLLLLAYIVLLTGASTYVFVRRDLKL